MAESVDEIRRSSAATSSRSRSADQALLLGALAQLLDFALGREDAARLGARAALDPRRAVEDLALERRDRAAGPDGGLEAAVEVVGDPGIRED